MWDEDRDEHKIDLFVSSGVRVSGQKTTDKQEVHILKPVNIYETKCTAKETEF